MNGVVRCHSLTCAGDLRIGADADRVGPDPRPERRHHGRDRAGNEDHQRSPRRSMPDDIVQPRVSQQQRHEDEAAVEVRPRTRQHRHQQQPAGVPIANGNEQQQDGEDHDPEQLRAQGERR